jgi:hypothetical protein
MIFSFSIGLCVDNDVDNNNGNCVTDAVFEPAPIEINGNFKHSPRLLQQVWGIICSYETSSSS